jgi:DNA adenine methylase
MKNKKVEQNLKPFLRWAGGKSWLRKYIDSFIPSEFGDYYEPFLGGGSIFFYLKSNGFIKNKAYLSDSNKDLINTYRVIKSNLPQLIQLLSTHIDNEKQYYIMRDLVFEDPIERAAQFLFLNKTSFNGIYRVNKQGEYNVPYGYRHLEQVYDFKHLKQISNSFKNTFFSCQDFKTACKRIKKNDFVFIDPPYTVAHENNGFVQYNQSIFSWKNQIQLSEITQKLDQKGAHFIVTNAYHTSIKELYTVGSQSPISRSSVIGGKGATRTTYNEILITNTHD